MLFIVRDNVASYFGTWHVFYFGWVHRLPLLPLTACDALLVGLATVYHLSIVVYISNLFELRKPKSDGWMPVGN